jgi:microcin C transport system substrate-binding protein
MFALVWNTRRPLFANRRVRRALGQAFDFEWVNANFFHDAFRRTDSFAANSDLAAAAAPSPAELALLAPFRDAEPPGLFQGPYLPPGDARQGSPRERLRRADRELAEAGYVLREQRRVDAASGRPFTFEILLARREDERLALTFASNLERLGIEARVRMVDGAQYQERLNEYDFDAVFFTWDLSLSPGNELAFYWGAAAASQPGTRNYPGIVDPAVDAMIAHVVDARRRQDLVASVRAMDRLLLWGDYVLPMYHDAGDRLVYWDRFGMPEATPLYGYQIEIWWEDAGKLARLR